MELPKPAHIEILDRLIAEFASSSAFPPDCQQAAVEELNKYIKYSFDDIEMLRYRWNILTDDEERAEKRMIHDLNPDKAKAHLARCKARVSANIAYGKELRKLKKQVKGGQDKAENND